MGSEKRRRQRQARLQRREQVRVETTRGRRVRQIRVVALIVVAVLGGALLLSLLGGGDDGDDLTTEGAEGVTDEQDTDADTDDADADAELELTARPFEYGSTPCPPAAGAEHVLSFDDSFQDCLEDGVTYTATFETTAGTVVVALDTESTPGTANNFVALARHGYYDGTLLFRTDPSIGIIQGGSPATNGPGDPGPGYDLPDEGEFGTDPQTGEHRGAYTYRPGQLVMARSPGPDGAGAQFFLTVTDAVRALDAQGTYVVFGSVTEGLDVLEGILDSHVDDPANPLGGAPDPEVTVTTVTITES